MQMDFSNKIVNIQPFLVDRSKGMNGKNVQTMHSSQPYCITGDYQ